MTRPQDSTEKRTWQTPVCIIGAGPAGAAASLTLSGQNIAHVVVEAGTFPRNKPCGDILTSGAVRALSRLDPSVLEELESRGLLNPVWKTSVFGPGGQKISVAFRPLEPGTRRPGCYSVNRWDMDEVLFRRIEASPLATLLTATRVAQIHTGRTGVQIITQSGDCIEAEGVILATGSSNSLLRDLGLDQEKKHAAVGVRVHFEGIETEADHTELFLLGGKMPGGLYITPLAGNRFNVNLVLSLRKVNEERINLRETLEKAIREVPVLKEKFRHARPVSSPEGSQLFLGLTRRKAFGNRLLVAGDAAGLIEFFSGNGIPQAFISGQMAAGHMAAAVRSQDFSIQRFGMYQKELFARLKPSPAFGRWIFGQLHRPGFQKFFLRLVDHITAGRAGQELTDAVLYSRRPGFALLNPALWYRIWKSKPETTNSSAVVTVKKPAASPQPEWV